MRNKRKRRNEDVLETAKMVRKTGKNNKGKNGERTRGDVPSWEEEGGASKDHQSQ